MDNKKKKRMVNQNGNEVNRTHLRGHRYWTKIGDLDKNELVIVDSSVWKFYLLLTVRPVFEAPSFERERGPVRLLKVADMPI